MEAQNTLKIDPDRFNADEAAKYLGLASASCLWRLRSKGLLKGFRLGSSFQYMRADLDSCVKRVRAGDTGTVTKSRKRAKTTK